MDNIFKRWRGMINEMLYFSPEDEEKHALELKFGIQIPDIDFHFEDYPDKQSKDKILNSGTFYVPYKKIYLGFKVETPLANLVDVLPSRPQNALVLDNWLSYARVFGDVDEASENPVNKLAVFDFDATLFKSPDKPKGYKGNWWIKKDSLGEPNVPEIPNDKFWNMDIVKQAEKNIKDPSTYCVLMTGRVDKFFEDRIKQLLSQKHLNFKEVHLNEFGRDTSEFKIATIKNILKKYPSIKSLEMWDDDEEKAEDYKEEFKSSDLNFNINMVKEVKSNNPFLIKINN